MSINHLMEALGRYAIAWSWQTALLIAFVWMTLRIDRRHRPDLRYRLLALTLALSVVLPWATEAVASFNWTVHLKAVWLEPAASTGVRGLVLMPSAAGAVPPPGVLPVAVVPQSGQFVDSGLFFRVFGFIWCAGVGIAAARKLAQHLRFNRIVELAEISQSEHSPLPIRLSDRVSGPMLYGVWQPVILLPQNISDWSSLDERLAMVDHECAHFTRKDHWASMVEGVLRTIFFFHPMFRWLCRRLDIEREILCDVAVLRRGSAPEVYTKALLRVAEHAVVQPGGVQFGSAGALNERIELVLRPHTPTRAPFAAAALVAVVPLVALGFSQSIVPAPEPVESSWVLRLLPRVPLEGVKATVAGPRLKPSASRIFAQQPQQPVSSPTAQQSTGLQSSVMFLRSLGGDNEVRITLGIPYTALRFSEQTTRNGMSVRQATGTVSITIEALLGVLVTRREDPIVIEVPTRLFSTEHSAVYQQALLLPSGSYRLNIRVTDTVAGTLHTLDRQLDVPDLRRARLASSSLVLADLIDVNPSRALNTQFNIGELKVRPSVTRRFRSNQELMVFQRVYSDGSAPLDLEVQIRTANNQILQRIPDKLQAAAQIDVTKTITLLDLPPGSYTVRTSITHLASGANVVSSEYFTVE